MAIEDLRFTVLELCALLGLIQCVYILVYMGLRAGQWSQAVLPFSYFLLLALAFLGDFAFRFLGELPLYRPLQWGLWLSGIPLSVLVIIQITNFRQMPSKQNFAVLLLIPIFIGLAALTAKQHTACAATLRCEPLLTWLIIYGTISGAIAMLVIWLQPQILSYVRHVEDYGSERFWLIMAMIAANCALLLLALVAVAGDLAITKLTLARDIIGLGSVYLAGTNLFRIYPRSIKLANRGRFQTALTAEEKAIAKKIEKLLEHDKVYHEPAYSRVDMARELNIAETRLSRIVNNHFGKSLPQLLNEYRVADARYFLRNTDVSIQKIAQEAGFNSLASFNRVFRDVTGKQPSAFRENNSQTDEREA